MVLGLDGFGLSAYSPRHGGASHDLLTGSRSLQEVKRRGRWASDESLKRYGKETKLIEVMARVPPRTVASGEALHRRHAQDILLYMPGDLRRFVLRSHVPLCGRACFMWPKLRERSRLACSTGCPRKVSSLRPLPSMMSGSCRRVPCAARLVPNMLSS